MADLPKCMGCKKKFSPLPAGDNDHVPLLLRCSHTICKRCISKLVAGKREITCRACNVKTSFANGKESISDLWPNIYYAGVMACGSGIPSLSKCFSQIDHIATVSIPEKDKSLTTLCSECVCAVATCRCCQCFADMCDKCFSSIHTNSRLLQQHIKVALRPSLTETECAEHGTLLEFYCEDDKVPVCPDCMISSTHRNHNIIRMTQKYENHKHKIMDAKLRAESAFLLSAKVKSRIQAELRHVKADAYEQAKAVHSHFLSSISRMQVNYLAIIKELEECAVLSCEELIALLEEIEEKESHVKESCSDADLMLSDNSKMQIVLDPEKLLSSLQEFSSLPYNFEKILEFQASEQDVDAAALTSEFFRFTPSYEMISLLEKFGEIEITRGYSFKLSAIEKNMGILDALPLPQQVVEKPKMKSDKVLLTEQVKEPCSKSQELVKVTYVESPTNFKVQRVSDQSHVAEIERCLNSSDGKFKFGYFQSVSVGELCAANYDRTESWYRARVVEKVSDSSKSDSSSTKNEDSFNLTKTRIGPKDIVEVCFIDYGNTAMTKVKCLRRLPQEMRSLPGLSISCCLNNVHPADGDVWSLEANQYFAKLIDGNPLLMTTVKRGDGVRYVNLHRTCAEEIDDDTSLSIVETLLFLGFAKLEVPLTDPEPTPLVKKFLTPTPLRLNYLIGVSLSFMESPECFYVQRNDSNKMYLKEMEKKIQIWIHKHIEGKKAEAFNDVVHDLQVICPKAGMICLAYFPTNGVWYRAEVLRVNDDRTVVVHFVDFGNDDTIHFSGLMKIPEVFTRLPVQAMRCKLHHVKPLPNEEGFSLSCVKRFAELCSAPEFIIMDVRDVDGTVYSVDLYDSSDEGSDFISISNHLYHEGLLKCEKSVIKEPDGLSKNDSTNAKKGVNDSMKIEARVTCAVSPALFFLQTESSCAELNKMMRKLQVALEEIPNAELEDTWEAGIVCGARSSREKRWCRGRIESVEDNGVCCVTMIDFGWRERVHSNSLKKLPEEFLESKCEYVLRCSLGGVVPAGGTDKWTATATDYFKELTEGEECVMDVMIHSAAPEDTTVVDLWIDILQNADGPDADNMTAISKALIMKGLALPIRRNPSSKLCNGKSSSEDQREPPSDVTFNPSIEKPIAVIEECVYQSNVADGNDGTDGVSNGGDDVISGQSDNHEVDMPLPIAQCKDGLATHLPMPYPAVPLLNVGKKIRCSVSHVHNEEIFYIKRHVRMDDLEDDRCLVDDSFEWKMAMMDVQGQDKTPIEVEDIYETMPCLSLYENDQRWHRAIILTTENLSSILVQYVDFGTLEEVPLERLRSISKSIMQLPLQTFMCGLANQNSLGDVDKISFLDKFCHLVEGQYLEAEVHDINEPVTDFAHFLCIHMVSLFLESGTKLQLM